MIAVLGAGLSGLQAARRLMEAGKEVAVFESKAAAGGLCRTITQGAHSWDLGPHGFYSKKPEAMAHYRALPLDYYDLERDVRVCHRDGARVFELNYPFENGLHELPPRHKLECVAGYCLASWRKAGPFRHLRHWIEQGLGFGIAKHFMLPYNRKIWSVPLERISMDLVSQKIEPEPAWNVVRNAWRGGSVGRAYQARFIYPKGGGAGAIPLAVAAQLGERVKLGAAVAKLSRGERGWSISLADGTRIRASQIVSTIPIPELIDALDVPALTPKRSEFAFNDTVFVVVGLKPGRSFRRFKTCQWVFFAGPEVFYRISLMENFDRARPSTVVAEITSKGGAPAPTQELAGRVVADLLECGVLGSEDDVALTRAAVERYTYPIQTLGMPEARAFLESRLEPQGLFLLGRMGRWEYINTDGVFLRVDDLFAGRGKALVGQ